MTPRKRKADPTSLAESSDGSPHKRIRSESTNDTDNRQNGNNHTSNESSDDYTENSIHVAKPSRSVPAASSKENEDALLGDLPQSWDEASAADKLLVKIKMEKGKHSWAQIEKLWERLAGKKPAKDTLSDRYRRLKDIMAHKKPGAASGVKIDPEVVEEPLEISAGISTFPTTEVRPSSRSIGGPPNKSPHAFSKGPMTAAKTSDPASSAPSARSSRAISNRSKATTKRSKHASAAPDSEVSPRQDLPQSWDQADAGDQLIVSMKTSRIGWSKIEEAWQRLTGERPAEGALQDRYTRIKELVIRPGTHGAYTYKNPKLELGTPRKRKAKAELSEQSSDQTSDQSSDESSNESSDGFSKQSITMARRKPRDAIRQQTRASAYDGQSDEPISKGTKLTTEDPSNGRADTGSSDESDEVSKHSTSVIKSAKRRHGKHAFAADSGAQNTAETANDMLVEMRERGCTWVEISQAWNERTGLTHVPETLRKRYARIKKGSATQLKSLTQVSNKRKVIAVSPDEGSYEPSAKRSKSTAETSRVAETPTKRNVDRGKRKSSVKYTDSTTDEDEIFSAPAEPISTAPARRTAGRSAKVNRSDPEWLVTNEKSPLADEDLHAEFSDPKTYEDFTRSDWEDLREVLPHDVPINPDGYSIPMEFFKYDPDFRRGLREFQEDLALGRLDPTWQADAAQAMEERARGEFDAYKENQFEAFWGQKQKLNHDALAGESTKIKLDLLIQNEMFRVGDYFSYSRVFGRGKNGVLVEKDCKVSEVLNPCSKP